MRGVSAIENRAGLCYNTSAEIIELSKEICIYEIRDRYI